MLGFILLFRENRMLRHPAVIAVLVALLLLLLLGWYWSDEPDFVRLYPVLNSLRWWGWRLRLCC